MLQTVSPGATTTVSPWAGPPPEASRPVTSKSAAASTRMRPQPRRRSGRGYACRAPSCTNMCSRTRLARTGVRVKGWHEQVFALIEHMCYDAPVLQDDHRRRRVDGHRLHADAGGQILVLRCCDRGLRTPPLPYLTAPPGTALGAR